MTREHGDGKGRAGQSREGRRAQVAGREDGAGQLVATVIAVDSRTFLVDEGPACAG